MAYDPEDLRLVLADLCEESGVRLLFHALACEGLRAGDRLAGVAFQGKQGRFAVLADVVVDATGDGDVFASIGVPFATERVLPWLWLRMGGVNDVDAAIDAGAPLFRTVRDGQVLLPWGAPRPSPARSTPPTPTT